MYLDGKYDASHNKTHCEGFVVGGCEIRTGDLVALKVRPGPILYAKIKDVSLA